MRIPVRFVTFLVLLAFARPLMGQNSEIIFVNETGATIYYLYASPVTADAWGEDLLGKTVLADGTRYRARLRSRGPYDIRAVDSNDNEYIIWDWNGRSGDQIAITRDAFVGVDRRDSSDPSVFAWVDIINDTNYAVEQIIIVPAGSGRWQEGELMLSDEQIVFDGERYRLDLGSDAFDTLVYDIMIVDVDGDRYIKREVNLEITSELVFTLEDLEL